MEFTIALFKLIGSIFCVVLALWLLWKLIWGLGTFYENMWVIYNNAGNTIQSMKADKELNRGGRFLMFTICYGVRIFAILLFALVLFTGVYVAHSVLSGIFGGKDSE